MTVVEGGGIFVSYRRQESSDLAGRLYDHLANRFGESQVFMDVDTIEPGVDFAEEIFHAVAACKVLLAIIGPNWLTATDERGGRRLDDADDIVRLEIEAALARGVRVIPILMAGAVMPGGRDLPESLAGLARRSALLIRHESFRYDAGRLVAAIEPVLTPASGTAAVSSAPDADDVRSAGNASGEVAQKGSGPVRNDPDRAAQLLTDAESNRQATEDADAEAGMNRLKVGKEQACSTEEAGNEAGEYLVISDPQVVRPDRDALGEAGHDYKPVRNNRVRATRLLAEAERIARSEHVRGEAEVLAAIVGALAATDPDRAERIALSIADENEFWKASALAMAASALAFTDSDRAASLADIAERIALSIADEYRKAEALTDIAGKLAATAPDRAERIALLIAGKRANAEALAEVAGKMAATDPDRAERIALSITGKSSKAKAFADIARALATTDPDRTERIAMSITEQDTKAEALTDIAGKLAATDPDRAARLADEAERVAQSLSGKKRKAEALTGIAAALAATDPDRAVRLADETERVAQSISNQGDKAELLANIAWKLAATDPARAVRLTADAERIGPPTATKTYESRIGQWLAASPPEWQKSGALAAIASALAATDPDRAERFAEPITDEYVKGNVCTAIAGTLAATDPDRAERFAVSITDEYTKTKALTVIAGKLAATDPDRAEQIARSITYTDEKIKALIRIAEA
jgi:TIR domain-containing protein